MGEGMIGHSETDTERNDELLHAGLSVFRAEPSAHEFAGILHRVD
jgi:hypothetical protein